MHDDLTLVSMGQVNRIHGQSMPISISLVCIDIGARLVDSSQAKHSRIRVCVETFFDETANILFKISLGCIRDIVSSIRLR